MLTYVLACLLHLGQPVATLKADPQSANAAERYVGLLETMDRELVDRAWAVENDPQTFHLGDHDDLEFTADDVRKSLVAQKEWIARVVETARMERCEFGVPAEQLGSLQRVADPPISLTQLRRLGPILHADACRRWADGDGDGAIERIVGRIELARDLAAVPSPMWMLVAEPELAGALQLASTGFESETTSKRVTDAGRANLRAAIATLDATDPLGTFARWKADRDRLFTFADQHLKGDIVGDPLLLYLAQMAVVVVMDQSDLSERLRVAAGDGMLLDPDKEDDILKIMRAEPSMSAKSLRKSLDRAREVGKQMEELWTKKDVRQELKDLGSEVDGDLIAVSALIPYVYQRWEKCNDLATALDWLKTVIALDEPSK
ncbi:MAG: hypothetical protein GIKADHBN_01261 [Phycisphaerales bacterium]|nr:hypothetical protein [Phycisphaerales bacterium]